MLYIYSFWNTYYNILMIHLKNLVQVSNLSTSDSVFCVLRVQKGMKLDKVNVKYRCGGSFSFENCFRLQISREFVSMKIYYVTTESHV